MCELSHTWKNNNDLRFILDGKVIGLMCIQPIHFSSSHASCRGSAGYSNTSPVYRYIYGDDCRVCTITPTKKHTNTHTNVIITERVRSSIPYILRVRCGILFLDLLGITNCSCAT